jgi:hypothetical protein
VGFEGVAQGKIRRAAIECWAIVKNASLWDKVPIASEERSISVCFAGTRSGAGIGYDGRDAHEAVGRERPGGSGKSAGSKIGVQCVIVFGHIGIATAKGETLANTLLEREDFGVVRSAVPGAEAVDGRNGRYVCKTVGKRDVSLANSKKVNKCFAGRKRIEGASPRDEERARCIVPLPDKKEELATNLRLPLRANAVLQYRSAIFGHGYVELRRKGRRLRVLVRG